MIPIATYGATLVVSPLESGNTLSTSRQGLYMGGLAEDGILQHSVWKFEINFSTEVSPTSHST